MGLFNDLFGGNKNNKSHEFSEEELDNWGLSDEEKELVNEGYEPWNFDEDDSSDDDDYYNEDE